MIPSKSETVNAELRSWRGLGRILVRGLAKARCIARPATAVDAARATMFKWRWD
jgi:hypothetical protein